MRILHTSDWHLGKSLETKTRYEEQQHFIDEISDIIDRKNIDVVILSGDVFDTSNPPAAAEAMFFNSIVRLAKDRTVPVVVIAGNHDSPDRSRNIETLWGFYFRQAGRYRAGDEV